MKSSLIRQRTSLLDSILEELNKQMAIEAHSCAAYLSMSAWFDIQGLVGCAHYFKKQSGEEREHQLRIFDYVTNMGALAVSPKYVALKQTSKDFATFLN